MLRDSDYYRLHTKYGGRYCFHRRVSFILPSPPEVLPRGGGVVLSGHMWGVDVWSGGGCLVRGGRPPPPLPEMATAAVCKHPTGMRSCFLLSLWINERRPIVNYPCCRHSNIYCDICHSLVWSKCYRCKKVLRYFPKGNG